MRRGRSFFSEIPPAGALVGLPGAHYKSMIMAVMFLIALLDGV